MHVRGLVVALLVGCLCTAGTAGAATHSRVEVTHLRPFTVRGTHFRSRERVLLIVRTKSKTLRTVAASRSGSFLVRIRRVRVGSCPSYSVVAVGTKGSRARIKLRATDCPPPASP
jgi:hypothetical protein